jgi:tetratricopeptide (TPR) repeat protein
VAKEVTHRLKLILALLACAILAGSGAYVWRARQHQAQVIASLPEQPSLAGKPDKLRIALQEASVASRIPGKSIAAIAELGRLYHANGYRAEAETCWRLLRDEQPRDARWAYYLADLRKTAGDYAGMLVQLNDTVKIAPDYAPAWLQLGEQAFKTGDYTQAENCYGKRLALVPGDAYARLGLARLALQRGQRSEARAALEELVRDVPAFPSSHNLLAEMLAADGELDRAQRERQVAKTAGRFREAEDPWIDELNTWVLDPKRLYVLGTMEFQTGHPDKARAYLERAAELVPGDPIASEMLGDLYLKLGKPQEARDALERCLKLTTQGTPQPMIFVMLSQACRGLQKPDDALRAAERGLKHWPEASELWTAKGAALADARKHDEALAAYQRALALNPASAEAAFNLGASYAALGKGEETVAALRRALSLQPRMPQALALLCRIELDTGQLADAGEHARILFENNSDHPQARQMYASWHLLSGREAEKRRSVKEAEQHYREGLTLVPTDPELNASLGVLCLVQTRFDEAVTPLEALQKARPEDPQAALFLGQAYAATLRVDDAKRVLTRGAELADKAGKRDTAAFCREILSQL